MSEIKKVRRPGTPLTPAELAQRKAAALISAQKRRKTHKPKNRPASLPKRKNPDNPIARSEISRVDGTIQHYVEEAGMRRGRPKNAGLFGR